VSSLTSVDFAPEMGAVEEGQMLRLEVAAYGLSLTS